MIASTILIFGKTTHTLFDTWASHSFIFVGYVNVYKLVMELLGEPMNVATSVNRSLVTERVCKSYNLTIGSLILLLT